MSFMQTDLSQPARLAYFLNILKSRDSTEEMMTLVATEKQACASRKMIIGAGRGILF